MSHGSTPNDPAVGSAVGSAFGSAVGSAVGSGTQAIGKGSSTQDWGWNVVACFAVDGVAYHLQASKNCALL